MGILEIHKELIPIVKKNPISLEEIFEYFRNLEKNLITHYRNYTMEIEERVKHLKLIESSNLKFQTKLNEFSKSDLSISNIMLRPNGRLLRCKILFAALLKNSLHEKKKVEIEKIMTLLESILKSIQKNFEEKI
jgi:hypothetical protein